MNTKTSPSFNLFDPAPHKHAKKDHGSERLAKLARGGVKYQAPEVKPVATKIQE